MSSQSLTLRFVVGAAVLVLVIFSATPMYFSLFALFLEPVSVDLGWDLSTFPRGLLTYSICFAIAAPFAGRFSDVVDVRIALGLGALATTIGLFGLSSMSGGLLELIFYSCLLGLGGALVGVTTLAKFIASYYEERRGLAMGIIFGSGPMLAGAVCSPLVSSLIEAQGWRSVYGGLAFLGAAFAALMLLVFTLLRVKREVVVEGEEHLQGDASGDELKGVFRRRDFWLLIAVSVVMPIVFGGISGHLVAIASENNLSAAFGATLLSSMFVGGVVAPVLAGIAADWLHRSQALLPFVAAPILGLLFLLLNVEGVFLVLGVAFIGLGFSAWSGQTALLVTRYFGLRVTGAVVGITYSVGGVFLGVGPVLLGLLQTAVGSYQLALQVCIALQIVATLLVFRLGPFPSFAQKTGRELVEENASL